MNIGDAVHCLKSGAKLNRSLWVNQYIYYVPPNQYQAVTKVAKAEFGEVVPYAGYIAMKTRSGIVTPYNFTHEDILAEDWAMI